MPLSSLVSRLWSRSPRHGGSLWRQKRRRQPVRQRILPLLPLTIEHGVAGNENGRNAAKTTLLMPFANSTDDE